jgi:hypothetical protein
MSHPSALRECLEKPLRAGVALFILSAAFGWDLCAPIVAFVPFEPECHGLETVLRWVGAWVMSCTALRVMEPVARTREQLPQYVKSWQGKVVILIEVAVLVSVPVLWIYQFTSFAALLLSRPSCVMSGFFPAAVTLGWVVSNAVVSYHLVGLVRFFHSDEFARAFAESMAQHRGD